QEYPAVRIWPGAVTAISTQGSLGESGAEGTRHGYWRRCHGECRAGVSRQARGSKDPGDAASLSLNRRSASMQDSPGSGAPPTSRVLLAEFERATQLHSQGRLEEAAASYVRILNADPKHAGALHLLGALALQRGNPSQGIELIGRSLRTDERQPVAWL